MNTFARGSGLAGAAGSLLSMVIMLGSMGRNVFLSALAMLLLLVSLVSLFVASRRMSLGLGRIGLVAATGGVVIELASITNDSVVLLGGRGLEGMWPLFFVGVVCILLGVSLYAASAAWAGLAPVWSVLMLVLGGASTAMLVLLMVLAPDGVQRTVGEGVWIAPFVLSLVFWAGWVVYAVVLVIGKVPSPVSEKSEGMGWARRAPAVVLFVLVAAGGIAWVGLVLFSWGTRVSADTATPPPAVTVRTPNPSARPVAVDTDMAMDDWLAILYLLQSRDQNVVAITVVGTGEAHCEPGVRNARGLLALAGYEHIPVACGRETPFDGGHAFPDEWRTGVDNMLGLTLPAPPEPVTDPGLDAPQLLASIADAYAGKLSLVTLGPLTNIADALQSDPSLATNLADFYIMGGAVHVAGNVQLPAGDMSAAEWNIYADPHAAALVFQSKVPFTLVSLDATNNIPLTTSYLKQLEANHQTPTADFVYRILNENQFLFEPGAYYLWDTLAAVLFTDHSLATFREERLQIIEDGPDSGRTAIAPNGASIRIPTSVDATRFQQLFLDALNTR